MPIKEYIAYKGSCYTIEWYYDESGFSQPFEYLMNLSSDMQKKVFYLFKRMGDIGKINDITKFRNEGDQIYAFKPQPDRFLSFFVKDKVIIISNAFRKKSDKLPINEKLKALRSKEDYLKRSNEGKYYGKE
jgi:phage-related protein